MRAETDVILPKNDFCAEPLPTRESNQKAVNFNGARNSPVLSTNKSPTFSTIQIWRAHSSNGSLCQLFGSFQ